jgi:hypothetical protein
MPGIQRSIPAILRSGALLWSTAILRSGAVLCSTAILPFAATIWSAILRLRLGQLLHVCRMVRLTATSLQRGGLRTPEKVFNELWNPSRGRLGARRGRKVLDDHNAVDLSPQVGVEEGGVVAEGHASVRLTVGAEPVGMCKQSVAAFAITDWNKANGANGTNAMERLLAHYEFVRIGRRGP